VRIAYELFLITRRGGSMLGLDESEIFREIDAGCFGTTHVSKNIPPQYSLIPRDILERIATGVAKAIEANNRAIEIQLRFHGKL
jgi:hypothetical protein